MEDLSLTDLAGLPVAGSRAGNPDTGDLYSIAPCRWQVLEGVTGEGILLHPMGEEIMGLAVVIPDAAWTAEEFCGADPDKPESSTLPRRLAAELYDVGRAYLAAKDVRARLEDAATRTLVQTADPDIDRRIAECEGRINFNRAKASLSEDDAADLAHAESEVESLPEMIARASGAEAVNLRIRLMEAEAKLEDLKPRMAEVAAARREIKRLEREQQAIAAERLVPENFALTD